MKWKDGVVEYKLNGVKRTYDPNRKPIKHKKLRKYIHNLILRKIEEQEDKEK